MPLWRGAMPARMARDETFRNLDDSVVNIADKNVPTPMVRTLHVLTLVSGLVDGVCYLGLGRVFTANMTGNIVVLGFAAAGAPGFSVTATLTSLALFLVGAACASRIAARMPARAGRAGAQARLLLTAIATDAGFVGAGTGVALSVSTVASGQHPYARN